MHLSAWLSTVQAYMYVYFLAEMMCGLSVPLLDCEGHSGGGGGEEVGGGCCSGGCILVALLILHCDPPTPTPRRYHIGEGLP